MELEYYRKALTLIDAQVDEDGFVVSNGDSSLNFKINKRFLVIPTEAILKKSAWETQIPFHPLCETSISNKRSIVLDKFIDLANFNLDIRIRNIISIISEKLSDKVSMPPDAMMMLSALCPDASENLKDDVAKIFITPITSGTIPKASERVLTVSLKRNVNYDSKKYKAVARATCMPYDEDEADTHFFGIKCKSKKNVRSIKGLLQLVLGGIEDLDVYSTATNTPMAPLWTAYTKTVGKIHEHLNSILDTFELNDKFEDVDTSFLEMNAEAAKIKIDVPSLSDNRGEYVEKDLAEGESPKTEPVQTATNHNTRQQPEPAQTNSIFSQAVNGTVQNEQFTRNLGGFSRHQEQGGGSIFAQAAAAASNPSLSNSSNAPRGRPGTGGGFSTVNSMGTRFSRSIL